jgi:hypothetical protein
VSNKKTRTLNVPLPLVFTVGSLYEIIGTLFDGLTKKPQNVVIDFHNLKRIQVGGVAVLSNMIEFCKKMRIQTTFVNVENCKASHFLDGAGFSALYLGGNPPQRNAQCEFLPLKLVEYDRSFSYVHYELMPWLSAIFGVDIRALGSLKVCFEEIFNNIKDHSAVDIGCSCAHFDKAKSTITICISDFGVGIPRKVKRKVKGVENDHEAIGMACTEGFTTQSTPGNMGAGLHVLIKNVTRNFGSVIIYSGKGIYSCVPGHSSDMERRVGSVAEFNGLYPGTMIYITLDTKKFVPSEIDEEDFVWE